MPKLNGVDAIAGIRQEWPDARIVVLTTSAGDAQALRALRAGAAGYLLKNSLRNELIDTIKSVRRGGKHLDPQVAAGMSLQVAGDALSERETTVLSLAANGNSNRQIANRLGLTEVTVKSYMKTIFLKLSASDRTHAVTIAAKRGIIEL
jgi:DNA-binding NarL/FixJ family response regulator